MRNLLKIDVEGKDYLFEFTRAIIQKEEDNGFNLQLIASKPLGMTVRLWYVGLRKNHKGMTLDEVGRMYDKSLEEGWDTELINEKLLDMYTSFFRATPTDSKELKKPTFETI